ncbi:hypothetical protein MBLNU457_5691t1 [Dothideomycetes sp. NU457]
MSQPSVAQWTRLLACDLKQTGNEHFTRDLRLHNQHQAVCQSMVRPDKSKALIRSRTRVYNNASTSSTNLNPSHPRPFQPPMCVTFQRKYLLCGCTLEDAKPCPKQGNHSFPTLKSQTLSFCPDHDLLGPELKSKMQRRYEKELVRAREQEILERMNWRLNELENSGLVEWERAARVGEIKEEARAALVALGPESEMGVGLARESRSEEKRKGS